MSACHGGAASSRVYARSLIPIKRKGGKDRARGRRVPTIWSRDLSTQSVVVTINSLLHFVASVQKAQRYKRGLVPVQQE